MSDAQIVPHGTLDYAEARALGVNPADLLVFSSNINPYGPPERVIETLRASWDAETIARYPDRLSLDLRDKLGEVHDIHPDTILVGNGTADIMWLIGLVHLRQRRVAILGPTFGEYANVAAMMEATILPIPLPGWARQGNGYVQADTTLADSCQAVADAQPDVVFVCNPNNPTGQVLTDADMAQLVACAPDALWIIDEAYAEFTDEPTTSIHQLAQTQHLILRSMTKDFALGGLRLGYAVGPSEIIAKLQTAQPPWNVNVMAQIAGQACLDEMDWRRQTLTQLRQDCAALQRQLRDAGYAPLPTELSFFLVPVSDASKVRQALLPQRLVVRDCTSFGLPTYIRIAVRRPDENDQLAAALAAIADWAALDNSDVALNPTSS